jgi:hypothetical protein
MSDDEGQTPLDPHMKGELDEIGSEMKSLVRRLGKVQKGEEQEQVEKAVWSTATINGYHDSSFLYIKPGGTKVSEGKSVPLSDRMFPVKDASGRVDLPHVRNAIARAPQADIPDPIKQRVQAQARRLLAEAQKVRFTGDKKPTKKDAGEDAPRVLEDLVDTVEKRGAKMSKDRLARLKSALESLTKLLSELDTGEPPAAKDRGGKQGGIQKSEGAEILESTVASLTTSYETLTGLVKKQAHEIRVLKSARPGSMVLPTDPGGDPVDDEKWPLDLNDDSRAVDSP